MFVVQILSMPALIYFLEQHAGDSLQSLQSHDILQRTLQLLIQDDSMKIITNSMQGTQSLALLANIVQLFYLEPMKNAVESGYPSFTVSFLALRARVSVQSIAIVHFISVDDMLETASEHTKYSGS